MEAKFKKYEYKMQDPTLQASCNHKDGSASLEIVPEED